VAAEVNGQPILVTSVTLVADVEHAEGDSPAEQRAWAYRKALQGLVVRELLFQEALRRGLEADSKTVAAAYDQARLNYKDDGVWAGFLEQQGMTEEQFRTELRLQQTVNVLMRDLVKAVPQAATVEQARRYYDENPEQFETGERLRASHILLRVGNQADPAEQQAARDRIEGIRTEIEAGAAFAALAAEHSEDAGSSGKGGELQMFTSRDMAPAFSEAAFALKPGELSQPVVTPFGLNLILLHERLPSERRTFESVEQRLRAHVAQVMRQQAIQVVVAKLRERATIETFL
jgi:parvulin-like peptidyl-prolyl isomerase